MPMMWGFANDPRQSASPWISRFRILPQSMPQPGALRVWFNDNLPLPAAFLANVNCKIDVLACGNEPAAPGGS